MNSENVGKHLDALWRTDRIIARIGCGTCWSVSASRRFAALIAASDLRMLELAAYFEPVQVLSAVYAAVILGEVNFAVAAILFAVAARPAGGHANLSLRPKFFGTSIKALQLEARCDRHRPE